MNWKILIWILTFILLAGTALSSAESDFIVANAVAIYNSTVNPNTDLVNIIDGSFNCTITTAAARSGAECPYTNTCHYLNGVDSEFGCGDPITDSRDDNIYAAVQIATSAGWLKI